MQRSLGLSMHYLGVQIILLIKVKLIEQSLLSEHISTLIWNHYHVSNALVQGYPLAEKHIDQNEQISNLLTWNHLTFPYKQCLCPRVPHRWKGKICRKTNWERWFVNMNSVSKRQVLILLKPPIQLLLFVEEYGHQLRTGGRMWVKTNRHWKVICFVCWAK